MPRSRPLSTKIEIKSPFKTLKKKSKRPIKKADRELCISGPLIIYSATSSNKIINLFGENHNAKYFMNCNNIDCKKSDFLFNLIVEYFMKVQQHSFEYNYSENEKFDLFLELDPHNLGSDFQSEDGYSPLTNIIRYLDRLNCLSWNDKHKCMYNKICRIHFIDLRSFYNSEETYEPIQGTVVHWNINHALNEIQDYEENNFHSDYPAVKYMTYSLIDSVMNIDNMYKIERLRRRDASLHNLSLYSILKQRNDYERRVFISRMKQLLPNEDFGKTLAEMMLLNRIEDQEIIYQMIDHIFDVTQLSMDYYTVYRLMKPYVSRAIVLTGAAHSDNISYILKNLNFNVAGPLGRLEYPCTVLSKNDVEKLQRWDNFIV